MLLNSSCRRRLACLPRWRVVLTTLAACLATHVWALAVRADAQQRRPNVVVILTDDQGWGDLSVHGNTNLSTPNIDSLARSGAVLDRFYVCPVCSPTRAEFLTGRYHPRRRRLQHVDRRRTAGSGRSRPSPSTFQAAGYATAAFGKWHNGMQYPYHPNARGFDEYYGFCSGHWGNYFRPDRWNTTASLSSGKGFIVDDLTDHAIAVHRAEHVISRSSVYLPYNTPHSPMQVPDRFCEQVQGQRESARCGTAIRSKEDLDHHARGAGDVRKHRLERRPRARRSSTN